MSTDDLTPRQQKLYDALVHRGDVPIPELFEALNESKSGLDDVRYAQQWLGPVITSLNKRLESRGLRVVPGQLKRTYALTVVK